MSEFEGYQDNGNAGVSTSDVQYETMPDNNQTATATAYPPQADCKWRDQTQVACLTVWFCVIQQCTTAAVPVHNLFCF